MPTYQYACTECGEQLEAVQKFTDDPLTECPSCHGKLRKVFSAVGVVFKGSGFYKTDSRSSSSKSTKPADTSTASNDTGTTKSSETTKSESSGSSSTSTSTDSKPSGSSTGSKVA